MRSSTTRTLSKKNIGWALAGLMFSLFLLTGAAFGSLPGAVFGQTNEASVTAVIVGASVNINGTVGPVATSTVTVYYGTNPSTFTSSKAGTVGADKTFSINIGPFIDGTYYYVVRDRDGTTLVGTTTQEFTIGTGGTTTGGGSTTGGGTGIGGSSASVSAQDTTATVSGIAADGAGGSVTVLYGTDRNAINMQTTGTVGSDKHFSVLLASLLPGTEYSYYVRGKNGAYISAVATFTTTGTGGTPSGGLVNGDVTVVVGTKDISADIDVVMLGTYNYPYAYVDFGRSKDNLSGSAVVKSIGSTYRGIIWGLAPNTTYYYAVYAADDETKLSATVDSFRTKPGVSVAVYKPGVVLSMTVSKITQTKATVSGTVKSSSVPIEILADTNEDGSYETHNTPSISDKKFNFDITGLKPGHVYGLVITQPGNALVRYTEQVTFMTQGVFVSPYVQSVTDTSATIAAKISDGTDDASVVYGTDMAHLSEPVALSKGLENVYTAEITGLKPDTAYFYQIVSSTKDPYTNAYTFLTAREADEPGTVPQIENSGTVTPITYSGGGLVQCGLGINGGLVSDPATAGGTAVGQQSCGFKELMQMIARIIDFLIFLLAPIITTSTLLYAGVLILTSTGNGEKVSQAKGMMVKAVIGLVIAMGAWMIVKFVLVNLGYDDTIFAHFY